jgi:hypothetical protein
MVPHYIGSFSDTKRSAKRLLESTRSAEIPDCTIVGTVRHLHALFGTLPVDCTSTEEAIKPIERKLQNYWKAKVTFIKVDMMQPN